MAASLHENLVALIPTLRSRAEGAERERQIPSETLADFRNAGLLRAFVPKAFGGDERGLLEVFDAVTELAKGCSSSAWIGSLLATHGIAAALFSERAQRELWSDGPDTAIVSSIAPTGSVTRVDDGFRLAGRWSFVSGVDHGAWVMLGAMLKAPAASTPSATDKPEPPPLYFVLVPASDFVVQDDWHVSGLKGTGSKSVVLKDVFIPEHRGLSMADIRARNAPGLKVNAGALYRYPFRTVFNSAFPPVALGCALANVDDFCSYTASRVHAYTGESLRASPGHMIRVVEATTDLRSARALFRQNVESIEQSAAASPESRQKLETQVAYDCAFVVDRCSHAVYRLFRGSGGKALYLQNPLQRYFRDVHGMTQHAVADMDTLGLAYGAMLTERPPVAAPG